MSLLLIVGCTVELDKKEIEKVLTLCELNEGLDIFRISKSGDKRVRCNNGAYFYL